MKKFLLLAAALLVVVSASAASRKLKNSDTEKFQYEIEGVSNGSQGTYLVRVWSYSSKTKLDVEVSKKNAVHGVIFKGYAGTKDVRPQRPLIAAPGAEVEHADYFNLFFKDGGEYNKYVTITAGSQQVVKVGKQYHIGVVVSVSKDALRKALEQAGVLRSLGSGF
jgi:hypothetical protein